MREHSPTNAQERAAKVAPAASASRARQLEALRRAMGPELLEPLADRSIVEIMLNPDRSP